MTMPNCKRKRRGTHHRQTQRLLYRIYDGDQALQDLRKIGSKQRVKSTQSTNRGVSRVPQPTPGHAPQTDTNTYTRSIILPQNPRDISSNKREVCLPTRNTMTESVQQFANHLAMSTRPKMVPVIISAPCYKNQTTGIWTTDTSNITRPRVDWAAIRPVRPLQAAEDSDHQRALAILRDMSPPYPRAIAAGDPWPDHHYSIVRLQGTHMYGLSSAQPNYWPRMWECPTPAEMPLLPAFIRRQHEQHRRRQLGHTRQRR